LGWTGKSVINHACGSIAALAEIVAAEDGGRWPPYLSARTVDVSAAVALTGGRIWREEELPVRAPAAPKITPA
jgi:hypothetical protein